MDEKLLVKSERYNIGKGLKISFLLVTICAVIYPMYYFFQLLFEYISCRSNGGCSFSIRWGYCRHDLFSTAVGYAFKDSDLAWIIALCIIGGLGLVCLIIFNWMRSYEMVVTDKRVYGKTAFGKRVDLPMDSLSSIGSKWPNGVVVATSSGNISFLMIKNSEEIHKILSSLLVERQNKPSETTTIKQEIPQSNADELKKFKELLDSGIINQEEFDEKKKQLLGL